MNQVTAQKHAENGVNVQALLGAREALANAPEAARFVWKASSRWINGTHSRSTVHQFDVDHPEVFASEDHGPTPVEMVLVGLAGCLTAGIGAVAQMRDIQLNSVTATLEGSMDIQGILGMDGDIRNGFDGVKVTFEIDADASEDDIRAIVAQSQKRSAVYDIITNPTNVVVEVNSAI
jgi:uncharacterized OsmC-like protein